MNRQALKAKQRKGISLACLKASWLLADRCVCFVHICFYCIQSHAICCSSNLGIYIVISKCVIAVTICYRTAYHAVHTPSAVRWYHPTSLQLCSTRPTLTMLLPCPATLEDCLVFYILWSLPYCVLWAGQAVCSHWLCIELFKNHILQIYVPIHVEAPEEGCYNCGLSQFDTLLELISLSKPPRDPNHRSGDLTQVWMYDQLSIFKYGLSIRRTAMIRRWLRVNVWITVIKQRATPFACHLVSSILIGLQKCVVDATLFTSFYHCLQTTVSS